LDELYLEAEEMVRRVSLTVWMFLLSEVQVSIPT